MSMGIIITALKIDLNLTEVLVMDHAKIKANDIDINVDTADTFKELNMDFENIGSDIILPISTCGMYENILISGSMTANIKNIANTIFAVVNVCFFNVIKDLSFNDCMVILTHTLQDLPFFLQDYR